MCVATLCVILFMFSQQYRVVPQAPALVHGQVWCFCADRVLFPIEVHHTLIEKAKSPNATQVSRTFCSYSTWEFYASLLRSSTRTHTQMFLKMYMYKNTRSVSIVWNYLTDWLLTQELHKRRVWRDKMRLWNWNNGYPLFFFSPDDAKWLQLPHFP